MNSTLKQYTCNVKLKMRLTAYYHSDVIKIQEIVVIFVSVQIIVDLLSKNKEISQYNVQTQFYILWVKNYHNTTVCEMCMHGLENPIGTHVPLSGTGLRV